MHAARAGGPARGVPLWAILVAAACGLLGIVANAHAAARLPGQGVTAGGGHAFAGSSWLTSAAGQAGAGRASGGGVIEVAGWLRRPVNGIVGVPATPTDGGRLEFAVRPNPVTTDAVFAIRLPATRAGGALAVRVHDVSGRLVRVLRADATAGEHLLRWDGRDGDGTPVRPGVYLANLHAGGASVTRRLVIAH